MKRTTVFLDESTERDLKTIAFRKGSPLAGVVREALARYVVEESSKSVALPSFVGIGASGHKDTAERHDELIFADLETELPAKKTVRRPARPKSARRRAR